MKKFTILFVLFASASSFGARSVVSFNSGWRFNKGPQEGKGTAVTLPHTWNAQDGQSGAYYRGIGWYKKKFPSPSLSKDQHVFVKFDAANLVAEVFLNGVSLGTHQGGYTAFVFELTPHLNLNQTDNELAVKVDNSRNLDVPPLRADYTFFGGLYRNTWLIVTEAAHFSLADGAPGIQIETRQLTKEKAIVQIQSTIENQSNSDIALTQTVTLKGGPQDRADLTSLRIQSDKKLTARQELEILSPRLWQGVEDPFLYSVDVKLTCNDGIVIDEVTLPLGLRDVRVDPNHGVFLNGQHVELRGGSLHQDWKGEGWNVSEKQRAENIKILREMGVNAVRLSHYPRSEEEMTLLDRAGILAWSENPLINDITPSVTFQENTKQQLRELIRQKRHHPSILFWGLFNEVHEDPVGLIPTLNALAHQEDASRKTTAASDLFPESPINSHTDFIAFNMYYGWYPEHAPGTPGFGGDVRDFGKEMDFAHKLFADKPIGLSEYGAGGSAGQHEIPVVRPKTTSPFHPEEWQALVHEAYYEQLESRSFVFGHFIWSLFDFASPIRREGSEIGINDKGLVSYDRSHKKQAYYFYKAHWNPAPMVFLTSKAVTIPSETAFVVKAYSNLDSLELRLDQKIWSETNQNAKLPRQKVIFEWEISKLSGGPHSFEVRGVDKNGQLFSDKSSVYVKE